MDLKAWQEIIARTYGERDRRRGLFPTYAWFVEEVGELAGALLSGDSEDLSMEFSDVLAWLLSVAHLAGIDLDEAMARYRNGCPKCGMSPCTCPYRDPVRS